MADDGKIKFSDLIEKDDTIEYMILQLDELNKSFGTAVNAIRAGALKITHALKSVSSATAEGRQQIDEASISASRLERAQKELEFAMSDTGKQVAWLKEQTKDFNASSVNQKKIITSLEGSYNKLNAELKDNVDLWKSLSEAERNDAALGGEVLSTILNIKQRLGDLNGQMKLQVSQMSELEKAQQRLTFLRSEEGKKLIEVKRQISEILRGEKEEKQSIDQLSVAKQRLEKAMSAENEELAKINAEINQANRLAKLQAQLNNSAVGSYNQLAAQYEINKIKLNAMGQQQRATTAEGKKLEEETLNIYRQMIHLQEATGNYRLSVGHYEKAWNGLGNAMNQIVRELPSMAVSLNTFFLAISNNLPILWDEIDRTREKNKLLRAEGKQTQSVTKTIVSSIFSWQTALIVLISALSYNGEEILRWIKVAWAGQKSVADMGDVISDVNKKLKNSSEQLGEQIATLERLSYEWKKLGNNLKAEKQFIKDNKSEFDKLDVSIRNVNDAEKLLVDNTDAFKAALADRAKATAAMQIAAEYYGKAVQKQFEFEKEYGSKPTAFQRFMAGGIVGLFGGDEEYTAKEYQKQKKHAQTQIEKEIEYDNDFADKAVKLAETYYDNIDKLYKKIGLDYSHKANNNSSRTRRQKDLTDAIWKNDLSIQKKYEASITALQRDEFAKRKYESIDAAEATIREMQEKFRKNEVFLAGKEGTKPLTQEQKQQIQKQQDEIKAIIENTQRKLNLDLQDIEDERQIDEITKLRQTMEFRYDTVKKEIEKEKQLKLQQLDDREAAYSTKAATIDGKNGEGETVVTGTATKEQLAAWHKQRVEIEAQYDKIILDLRSSQIEGQLALVRKGTKEEKQLLLEQVEIARKLALAENRAKPIEQQQSEADINAKFNKKKVQTGGNIQLTNFTERQSLAKSKFDLAKHTADEIKKYEIEQEIALWKEKIRLAKTGAIEWSQAQIETARNTVAKLEKDLSDINDRLTLIGRIGKYGVSGFLLSYLGFDDDGINAWNDAVSQVISNLQEIAQAETDIAQAAVDAAEKRVEAAQSAYDAEVEARANGYANNVATAKKELEQEKRRQYEKQKLLEQAQKRQENINTLTQASSLITASANIWESMSSIPIIGPALAIAAIATMWTSFAAAKIKAKQATAAANQEYGEGGLEFLEGGSHASGNDIDLHQKNKKGKNMRAEGGEAMAIINKRNTKKYRKVLPDIVNSLNKGTFEDKYLNAFASSDAIQDKFIHVESKTDLSKLENGVDAIKKQNSERVYALNDTRTLIFKGNVRTYINN